MRNALLAGVLTLAAASSLDATSLWQAAESPFVGSWTADLSQSKLDPKFRLKGAELKIAVSGNVVTLASSVILPDGKTLQAYMVEP